MLAEERSKDLSTRLPTDQEQAKAKEALQLLAHSLREDGSLPLHVSDDGDEIAIDLPPALGRLVLEVLSHVAKREMVTLVPYAAQLTTQEAADLLNVSRPFLIKQLKAGEIAYQKVGTHRRILAEDLLAYRARRDADRRDAMLQLQRLGQELEAADESG